MMLNLINQVSIYCRNLIELFYRFHLSFLGCFFSHLFLDDTSFECLWPDVNFINKMQPYDELIK